MKAGYDIVQKDGKSRPVHILMAEQKIGRALKPDEVVHHVNGDKEDNRPENLQVMKRSEHTRLHNQGNSHSPETIAKIRKASTGRPNALRKLTEEQVIDTAEKLIAGISMTAIAKEKGVSCQTIMNIRDGKIYRDFLKDYPDEAFPLRKPSRKKNVIKNNTRKIPEKDVNEIRLALMSGATVTGLAKQYGVSPRAITDIRDGVTYREVPWPDQIVLMRRVDDVAELVKIFLSEPMSSIQDEYTALKEDYHLKPEIYAVTALRLVRRALMGDSELGLLLMAIGGYRKEADRIIAEESAILRVLSLSSDQ